MKDEGTPDALILSSLYDLAADMVVSRLEAEGVSYLRLNRQELAQHRITVDPMEPHMRVSGPAGRHDVRNLKSVWYRAPIFHRNTPAIPLSVGDQLARSQWMAFLRSLSVFEHARWMNHPSATYLAESKPYQLAAASQVGFAVPRTLITNDVETINATFPEELAVKSLDTVLLTDGDHSLFAYTTILSRDRLTDANVAAAPVIAQQALRDKTDLRVTVVGDYVFAVRVLRDGNGIEGDWRVIPKSQLVYESCQLTPTVENNCRELVQKLDLAFAAIDLIENDKGVFFVEVNPTGEWSWLTADDRPIDAAIATWLATSSG